MDRLIRTLLLLVVLPVMTACAHTRVVAFDDLFREGRYREAVEEAERNPGIISSETVLYRLALAHLVPESEVHDPFRAEGLLNELLARNPSSIHALEAGLLANQLAATRRAHRDVRMAEQVADSLRGEVGTVRQAWMDLQTRAGENDEEVERLRLRVRSLESDLETRQSEVAALQRTLDELKRIDLRRPGGQTPPPGLPGNPRTQLR